MKIPDWFPSTRAQAREIMATQAELKAKVDELQEALDAEQAAVAAAIQKLTDLITEGSVPDEIIAQLDAIKADLEGTVVEEEAPE